MIRRVEVLSKNIRSKPIKEGEMANYYNREDDWNSESDQYSRSRNENRNFGSGYGAYDRDRYLRRRESDDYRDRDRETYGGDSESYGRGFNDQGQYGQNRFGEGRYRPGQYSRSPYGQAYRQSQYGTGEYGRNQYGQGANRSYSDYDRSEFRGRTGPSTGRYYQGTNRPPYYGRDFEYEDRDDRYAHGENERGWWDRASDEVASWFGDEEAERRRNYDEMRDAKHRGKGPRDYRRSDERIREDVNDRLTDHSYLDASDISVSVKDGEVTLTGTVAERRYKRIAEDVAESVSGVKHVQNNIRVSAGSQADLTTPATPSARAAKL